MIPEAKKTVYLLRHGESVDNTLPVFQSEDTPLSAKGRQQAELLADRIAHLSFEALISSPYPRAAQTAQAIAQKTNRDIVYCDLFTECIKPSSLSGKPWSAAQATTKWRAWEDSLYDNGNSVEDGEDYATLVNRADQALEFLLNRPEQSLAVVSHGHFIRTIISRIMLSNYLSGPILRGIQSVVSMENTGISVLLYDDAFEEDDCWRLWTHNDHAHFAE